MKNRVFKMVSGLGMALGAAAFTMATVAPMTFGAENEAEAAPKLAGSINFTCGNAVSTAEGTFHKWTIKEAKIDQSDLSKSTVTVEVDIDSIDTNIKMRDNDLKKEEFFDVANHPTATVTVSKFVKKSEGSYTATMELNIKGTKKSMPVEFKVTKESPFTVEGAVSFDRRDFNVGGKYRKWNPMSVKPDVIVTFTAEVPES